MHQINEINCLNNNNTEIINENNINLIENNIINTDKILPRLSIKLTFIEPSQEEKEKIGYQKPLNILEANLINKYKNDINDEKYK